MSGAVPPGCRPSPLPTARARQRDRAAERGLVDGVLWTCPATNWPTMMIRPADRGAPGLRQGTDWRSAGDGVRSDVDLLGCAAPGDLDLAGFGPLGDGDAQGQHPGVV